MRDGRGDSWLVGRLLCGRASAGKAPGAGRPRRGARLGRRLHHHTSAGGPSSAPSPSGRLPGRSARHSRRLRGRPAGGAAGGPPAGQPVTLKKNGSIDAATGVVLSRASSVWWAKSALRWNLTPLGKFARFGVLLAEKMP